MSVIPGLGTVPAQEQEGIQFITSLDNYSWKCLRKIHTYTLAVVASLN